MIIVASKNGRVGMAAAMTALKQGGSAVAAVEAGVRAVEENPAEHTVGYNGYPNMVGQVELDASIMDGATLRAGAVAALKGYPHAISLACRVMEKLPHVLLVGEGAARFAAETGLEPREPMLTEEIRQVWQERLEQRVPPETWAALTTTAPLTPWVRVTTDTERVRGTVNFIVQDRAGRICSGVSTSGWAWKYPGRVGDSPLIGAGNYADDRYGAAACTGLGEMAIRACTAHSVVVYLRLGFSVSAAGRQAMEDLRALGGDYLSDMSLIVLDRSGQHAAFSSQPDKTYLYQEGDMTEPAELDRTFVALESRWGPASDPSPA